MSVTESPISLSPASLEVADIWDVKVSALEREVDDSLRCWLYLNCCRLLLRATAFTPRRRLSTAQHARNGKMRTKA